MSKWIQHIKDFAREKGITYGCALSDPACSASYRAGKVRDERIRQSNKSREQLIKEGQEIIKNKIAKRGVVKQLKETMGMQAEDINVSGRPRANTRLTEETYQEMMAKKQPKAKGRKTKYATEEERKKAKREQTLASNKRRYYEKKMETDLKL